MWRATFTERFWQASVFLSKNSQGGTPHEKLRFAFQAVRCEHASMPLCPPSYSGHLLFSFLSGSLYQPPTYPVSEILFVLKCWFPFLCGSWQHVSCEQWIILILFFLYKMVRLRMWEKCIALFVSGKELSLQWNHPLFLTWHLGIGSESVAGSFWTGYLFCRIWSAADSKAISCYMYYHKFSQKHDCLYLAVKPLRRLESRGDKAPAEQ